jgi:hypothetical protein
MEVLTDLTESHCVHCMMNGCSQSTQNMWFSSNGIYVSLALADDSVLLTHQTYLSIFMWDRFQEIGVCSLFSSG